MFIQLLPSGILPASEAVIMCEGVNTRNNISRQNDIDQKEGLTGDLQHSRDVDILNCSRLKQEIDKDDNIDCNELIAYWMMEGYLGHVDSVKEAYRKGHDIFMDFKYVKMPRAEFYEKRRLDSLESETSYKRYREFYSKIRLGFVDVFDFEKEDETPKFGKLVPDNGVVRTLGYGICSCLLLDGNQLDRQVIGHFNKHLKHFAYFNPRPNLLQSKLPGLNLSVLVLRGCGFLEEIHECIGEMSALTILEISGPNSSIKTIPDIFKKVTKLRSLNLSYLAIETLPKYTFSKLVHMRWLILRGCSRLIELPSTREMPKLELIDLYGATSLKKLSTTNFRRHPIKILDLSHTHFTRVPCLFNHAESGSSTITHLFLRNCSQIYVFDIMKNLVSLQVLDLSGAVHLKQINFEPLETLVVLDLSYTGLTSLPEDCFKNLNKLRDLNLSNIGISSMPSISHLSSLRRLIVRGCESLVKLELEGLVSLQVLDVSGCKQLQGLGEIPFAQWPYLLSLNLSDTCIVNFTVLNSTSASSSHQNLEKLQILDLSNTSIVELPSMSQFKSLKQLLLAGCSKLASVLDLEHLTKLEVLDLSGTNIEKEVLDKAPCSLRKLLLHGCSKIKGPLPLSSLTQLQELDLRGSGVAEFPFDIVGMTHLKCLRLPHEIHITGVDWSRIKDCLPDEILWDQPINIFESVNVMISNRKQNPMSAKPSSENCLFRLVDNEESWEAYFKQFHFSVPPKEGDENAKIHFGGVELVFKGNHPLARKVPYIHPQSPSVEIHGFSSFPEDTRSPLEKAVNVALVDNSFIFSLTDECFQHMKEMKVCWINSCTKMELVLGGENQISGVLETLVLSNLECLKDFSAENVPSQSIISLKHMYVDCCPVLNKIISASHLPENLETLFIKFCDELKALCNGNASECKLPKLHELSLLDLPKLQHFGVDLPSLRTLVIRQCPKLDGLGSILQCARSQLTRLTLDCCPQLMYVLSSSMLPESIQEMEIRSCDELTMLFDSAGSSSSTSLPSLPSLRRLQLWNLPKLKSIGGTFPSLQTREVKYCPRLLQKLWPPVKT